MTLREIAELAGVSPSAVSRYLNGGSLSAAKYEAIDKVIKETGYVPNQVAHDLRTGRVRQVGILVPKIHSKSVSQVVEGAHEVLAKAGYMTVLKTAASPSSSPASTSRTTTASTTTTGARRKTSRTCCSSGAAPASAVSRRRRRIRPSASTASRASKRRSGRRASRLPRPPSSRTSTWQAAMRR